MNFFTLLSESLLFSQAAPAAEQATAGQMISGFLVLPVMAASIAMIVVWSSRIRQVGHALPAANRGVLRVPFGLTLAAIGLSLLMLTLMSLVALENQLLPPAAAGPASPAAETGNSETSGSANSGPAAEDVADGAADKAKKTKPGKTAMTPANMVRALWQTVVMDIILFLVFGFVVFVFSSDGRVRLVENVNRLAAASSAAVRNTSSLIGATLWPDLDQPSGPPSQAAVLNPPFFDAETGGMAVGGMAVGEITSSGVAEGSMGVDEVSIADEPFSFLTELRFAGEVFLAAYVPTAALRILIVLLTVGFLGEEPEQHPFLEMMKSGVGTEILVLILLTAVILAPVVEELQYRVVVLGGIAQLGRPMLALGASSVLFAFAHGFPDSLALIPLAFALGYAYLRRRSYVTVILVHFLFNAFNMLLALLAML